MCGTEILLYSYVKYNSFLWHIIYSSSFEFWSTKLTLEKNVLQPVDLQIIHIKGAEGYITYEIIRHESLILKNIYLWLSTHNLWLHHIWSQ